VAEGRNGGKRGLDGLRNEAQQTVNLIVAYIKQETLDPVKGLGRYVLFGVVGSVALSIGLAVLTVGLLRVLQTETGSTFTGNLSWIPYVIVIVFVLAVAYVAVRAISRGQTPNASGGDTPTPTPAAPAAATTTPAAPAPRAAVPSGTAVSTPSDSVTSTKEQA